MNLHALLADGVKYAPHYAPASNSDHLPMALSAMSGLGVSEESLLAFREDYAERLHRWVPGSRVSHWREGVGQIDRYPGLMAYFQSRLESEDQEALLIEVLGVCLPGIAMDAFHPIIRLGYAVDFESSDEVAAALAYVTVVHREVPVSDNPLDAAECIMRQSDSGRIELSASRFGDSIAELIDKDLYPTGSAVELGELASLSLHLYQSTRNFFALHLVTSTQAIRVGVPEPLQPLALQSMTGALLASHLVLGSPALQQKPPEVPTQLDPEHAYKYVWSCLSEYRHYGDERYLSEIEAFKRAGLVPAWISTR